MAWALALAGAKPDTQVLAGMCTSVIQQLGLMHPLHVVKMCRALAALRHRLPHDQMCALAQRVKCGPYSLICSI